MANKVDEYVQRPLRYQYIDGVWEMAIGLMLMGMSTLNRVEKSMVYKVSSLAGWFLFCGAILYGVYALKNRVTYRRTGYVKYKRSRGKLFWLGGLAAAVSAACVGIAFRRFPHAAAVFPFPEFTAVLWALLYALMSRMDQVWRWIAILAMIAGPGMISTLPLPPRWGNALSTGFGGLVFFASGVVGFILYLRRTHPPEEAGNE